MLLAPAPKTDNQWIKPTQLPLCCIFPVAFNSLDGSGEQAWMQEKHQNFNLKISVGLADVLSRLTIVSGVLITFGYSL